jgi:anti-sigma B factor antagonist
MTIDTAGAVGRIEGSQGTIEMHGQVNRGAEEVISAAYESASGNGVTTLVLEFGDVEYINSTGIAVIVGILARARQNDMTVVARGLTDHYKHIFEITKLSDFMKIDDQGGAQ